MNRLDGGSPGPDPAGAPAAWLPPRTAGNRRGLDVDPERLRRARAEAGLSLAQLAAGVVSRAAVSQYETGSARPSLEVLEHLASRLGRSTDEFLRNPEQPYGDGRPPPTKVTVTESDLRLDQLLALAERRLRHRVREWRPELSPAEAELLELGVGVLRSLAAAVRKLEGEFEN